jgi:hypothetical protein
VPAITALYIAKPVPGPDAQNRPIFSDFSRNREDSGRGGGQPKDELVGKTRAFFASPFCLPPFAFSLQAAFFSSLSRAA